ncbi:MAG: nucleoside kinase [Lachnospiraceae bacterium]|nr:nucleoside kinase [Lachnospiraceae bacterium]
MENILCDVIIDNEQKQYEYGTTYYDIAKDYQKNYENDIVLVKIDGRLQELHKTLKSDDISTKAREISFITTGDAPGSLAYRRSATHLMLKAAHDIDSNIEGVSVLFSLSKGYFCKIKGMPNPDKEFIKNIENRMKELVAQDLPFVKKSVNTDEAIALFNARKMYDKEHLFKYRRVSKVNIYSLDKYEDYYYGYMVPSTGYLKYFELIPYADGFVIQLPTAANPKKLPSFVPQNKLFEVLEDSKNWGEKLGLETVADLNDAIVAGKISDLILVQEAIQEKRIGEIAQMIAEQPEKKLVMIAGPSSSGKTTFSHRLSIQLRACGLNPHPIAVDDYFIDREKCPKDANGKYDFECLAAVNVELFNKDMTALLAGETVELPTYNFKTGKSEYRGNKLALGKDDILVIEGIHCLNDALSHSLPKANKFKIYISALTQLNIDEHNRIPSTDGRLIRRMVRDARTRGISAKNTIDMWNSVRRGEENNIFPYQEEADVMFNSALIYELAVLKQFAEPALFGIDRSEPEYEEAKRLLKFLDYFVGISTENIPNNSILKEFIGGSYFNV